MVWESYDGKVLFLTGTTGFVGSSLLLRVLSQSSPDRVFVLCRGGAKGAAKRWHSLLPAALAEKLINDPRITVLDGDMTKIDFGLSKRDITLLQTTVQYVVHSASTIHLRMNLRDLSYSVIAPTMWLAELFFASSTLERFVFISTAYANSHLWPLEKDQDDVIVNESIHPLLKGVNPFLSAPQALQDIQTTGTTEEFEKHDFPWAYAYAKHLTERLLLLHSTQTESADKLLIVRPSIIGPAEQYPFPGFSTPTSTPTTAGATAFVLDPGCSMLFSSRLHSPDQQSTLDEVPVDVVVDRTLAHLALGTTGVVHAVSGSRARVTIGEWVRANNKERKLPWKIKVKWTSEKDWNSKDLSQLARIFKIVGASYTYVETKTDELAVKLESTPGSDRKLKLFAVKPAQYSLQSRRNHIRELGIDMAKRKGWPVWLVKVLSRKQKDTVEIAQPGDHSPNMTFVEK